MKVEIKGQILLQNINDFKIKYYIVLIDNFG